MTRGIDDPTARPSPAGDLARLRGADLLAFLLAEGATVAPNLDRGELLAAYFRHRLERGDTIVVEGAFELLAEGFGFVRSAHLDYEASPHDAFLSPSQVRALNLKTGLRLRGPVRLPRGNERFFALTHIDQVADGPPTALMGALAFTARTPVVATRPLVLPSEPAVWRTLATLTPWCRGQRVLIEAPAAWPRGPWLSSLASALVAANPGVCCLVTLLDQRPEDLQAAKALAAANPAIEVVGSSFDQPPERHQALAEFMLARAMREVEGGRDVVLLVDSLTALTLATQRAHAASGRWLCPGVDVRAVQPGKKLFAAARAGAEGGSLTVIATAIPENSAVANAVLSEFAGRGNAEVVIPAPADGEATPVRFDARRTRTRPEDDSRSAAEKQAAAACRAHLATAPPEN